MVVEIIGTIIFGAVIGMLARLVLPGRQNISALVTVILGVLGALIGYWLWGLMGGGDTSGIDWIRWIISIVVAAVVHGMAPFRMPRACPAHAQRSVRGRRPARQEGVPAVRASRRHTASGSMPPVRGGPCGGCARR